MKKIIKVVLVSFVIFGFFGTAYATLNIETEVDVPASCTATDTDGITHDYGNSYLAICAFEKALLNGSISNMQLSNQYPSLGLFVTSINNVNADPNSQYWAFYQNGNYASSGITQLPVAIGDVIMFQLHDFSDNSTGDQVMLHIHSLVTPTPASPTGSGPLLTSADSIISTAPAIIPASIVKPAFDIKKALQFLIAQQKSDGSFGEDLYTDWATMALASGNDQGPIIKLVKYLDEAKISGTLLTDYERHAMALIALGLNPYNIYSALGGANGENYIEKIISYFDGKQFGDANEDNDDIFALIVLQNAGYDQNEKIINDDINFILSRQKDNGSWDESVDMTGAGMEALVSFVQTEQIKNALVKAKEFLKQNQKDNGGWNNASSTAWALEGIFALNEKPEDWIRSGNTPLDYLASIQDTDGGVKNDNLQNKIWETAYVASVLSGKTWNQIMQKFAPTPQLKTLGVGVPTSLIKMPKSVGKKITITKPRPENLAKQNTATAINVIIPPSPEVKIETPKRNWFMRLLGNIFRF